MEPRIKIKLIDIPKKQKIQEWWIPGILPKGRLVILTASGGTGKSSLCTYLAKMLYEEQGVKTVYWAFEDDPTDFTNRIGFTPGIKLVLTESVRSYEDEYGEYEKTSTGFFDFRDESHWEQLGEVMREFGAKVLIIDPITQLYGDDENDGQKVRQFMIKFRDFALKEDITVVAVHHNRKNTRAGENNARGSTSWTDVPRHHLIYAEDDECRRFLEVYKTNLTKRGLSWEAYSDTRQITDQSGNTGEVFFVNGLVQVEDYAVSDINKRTNNIPLVVKNLKNKFDIGKPFNIDDVKLYGSHTEFYKWVKTSPNELQECLNKKDGKKSWIFIQ